jgi:hypothetical protein
LFQNVEIRQPFKPCRLRCLKIDGGLTAAYGSHNLLPQVAVSLKAKRHNG